MANILIVDDSLVIRKMLNAILEGKHKVEQACDGQEAYELLEEKKFDLVITDINMPIMNGFDLARKIRELDNHHKDMPIIVLSTEFSDDIKSEGKQIGINAWMVKPCEEEQLLQAIDHLVK